MATTTFGKVAIARPAKRGVFGRFLDALVASRAREAERIVAAHLLALDDEALARLGHDRAALEKVDLRRNHRY